MKTRYATFILSAFFLMNIGFAQNKNQPHLWQAQPDQIYMQETAEKIPTDQPVQSVAVQGEKCFAVLGQKLFVLAVGKLIEEQSVPSEIRRLMQCGEDLWALSAKGLFRLKDAAWTKVDDREFVDLCLHLGVVHAATKDEIFRLEKGKLVSIKPAGGYYSSDITMLMEDGSQVHADPVELGPIKRIASYAGTLYVLRPDKLIQFDGLVVNEDFIDWGSLPSKETRDMLSMGSRLLVSSNKGLGILRGAALTVVKGIDGLPVENTTCLAKGFADDVWIGTAQGAVRMLNNEWQYFAADNWLPGNHVNSIVVAQKAVYVATDKGIGVIRYEPFTLQKKAAYFEQEINDWGHKRLGFIHFLYKKDGEWIREISDNDGGHTAPYLAAMCYKYAVTGDPKAKAEAIEAFKALVWLQKITGTEGFIARAIWSPFDKDEKSTQGSGGLPARWYPTPDGKWFWKGDTSSDEVTAHFYAVSLFYDLVAEGKDKEMAKEHLQRMASYILKCNWTMHDMDGKPTRWARWNPEYLLRPYGYNDRGVNGLEVLSYMHAAYTITKDEKFNKGLQLLIGWGYPANTIRQKNIFPPATLAPWDDDLAFESYNTLFRYVDDPNLRSVYLRSLERTWDVKRIEHDPWYNFSYGAITGNDCELEQALKFMRDFRLDCIEYRFHNSDRDDLYPERGYVSYEGFKRAFSPREASSPLSMDGEANGNVVRQPTEFLRNYWMGRYYGFIHAPETTDPELTTVPTTKQINIGAKPFEGPQRPVVY